MPKTQWLIQYYNMYSPSLLPITLQCWPYCMTIYCIALYNIAQNGLHWLYCIAQSDFCFKKRSQLHERKKLFCLRTVQRSVLYCSQNRQILGWGTWPAMGEVWALSLTDELKEKSFEILLAKWRNCCQSYFFARKEKIITHSQVWFIENFNCNGKAVVVSVDMKFENIFAHNWIQ